MKGFVLFGVVFLVSSALMAQSRESADAGKGALRAGAEISQFNPDYYCQSSSPFSCGGGGSLMDGVGAFVDYNLTTRLGAEGEGRWLRWNGSGGQVESTYLIGPRFRAFSWRRVAVWPKFLVGIGAITTQGYPGPDTLKGTLFVYAPGVSVDYKLSRKFQIVGDYELQKWPAFAVLPPHNNGLSPTGVSVGFAYTLIGR